MNNWKTGYPRSNQGPNRRINEEVAEDAEPVDPENFLAAALSRSTVQTVNATTDLVDWTATDLLAPYDATNQPLATVGPTNIITLDDSGVFHITASVVARDDAVTHPAPDQSDRYCTLRMYLNASLIALTTPFHYGLFIGEGEADHHCGGTLTATLRAVSTDTISVEIQNWYNQTLAHEIDPAVRITIQKISD
jgi:hypothetical protein